MSVVKTLRSSLAYFIEPDFELLDHLLRLDVLNLRQLTDIRSERTVFRRNDALLDLLTSEEQCVQFLHALQLTDQQHVVNFVKENRSQKQSPHNLSVERTCIAHACTMKQTVKSHISTSPPTHMVE